mmetsp:Transcript_37572/g.77143  ORF Transcript_37572/g.77143 Transcript_37572/m.77143 type:complete len:217 (-) Transcript_37572:375-1025(-)
MTSRSSSSSIRLCTRRRGLNSRPTRPSSSSLPSTLCSTRGTALAPTHTVRSTASPDFSAPLSPCSRWCSATSERPPEPECSSAAIPPLARTSSTENTSSTHRERTLSLASAPPRPSASSKTTCPSRTRISSKTSSALSRTTRTCRTSSSRSRTRSSLCSSAATASAPAAQLSALPSTCSRRASSPRTRPSAWLRPAIWTSSSTPSSPTRRHTRTVL